MQKRFCVTRIGSSRQRIGWRKWSVPLISSRPPAIAPDGERPSAIIDHSLGHHTALVDSPPFNSAVYSLS